MEPWEINVMAWAFGFICGGVYRSIRTAAGKVK